jgi:hypothetical protein
VRWPPEARERRRPTPTKRQSLCSKTRDLFGERACASREEAAEKAKVDGGNGSEVQLRFKLTRAALFGARSESGRQPTVRDRSSPSPHAGRRHRGSLRRAEGKLLCGRRGGDGVRIGSRHRFSRSELVKVGGGLSGLLKVEAGWYRGVRRGLDEVFGSVSQSRMLLRWRMRARPERVTSRRSEADVDEPEQAPAELDGLLFGDGHGGKLEGARVRRASVEARQVVRARSSLRKQPEARCLSSRLSDRHSFGRAGKRAEQRDGSLAKPLQRERPRVFPAEGGSERCS